MGDCIIDNHKSSHPQSLKSFKLSKSEKSIQSDERKGQEHRKTAPFGAVNPMETTRIELVTFRV